MRIIFLLLIGIISSLSLSAQYQLKGRIISAEDRTSISEASILILGTQHGTITDQSGQFTLENLSHPFTIQVSHIGYIDQTITFDQPIDTVVIIELSAAVKELEKIVVTPYKKPTVLSNTEEKSIRDFDIDNQYIYTLEYFGNFRKQKLTVKNLAGEVVQSIKLNKIKQPRGLHTGCNNDVYLLARDYAYLINFENKDLSIGQSIPISKFDQFVKPCKVINESTIYYLFHSMNGLKRTVSAYYPQDKSSQVLREIGNPKSMHGYKADAGFIAYHSGQIYLGDIEEFQVNITRSTQATADFLSNVLYRPKLPVQLFHNNEALLVFNHPEQVIEFYEQGKLTHTTPVDYPLLDGWRKEVIQDPITQRFYALFVYGTDMVIKEIDITTGQTLPVLYIKEDTRLLQKVRVIDGVLYYTVRDQQRAGNKGLKKINL